MKIPEVKAPSTKTIRRSKKSRISSGATFSDHLGQASKVDSENEVSSENASVSGVNSMIAVQELSYDSDNKARRQLADWGNDILDSLDEIRHGLLIGSIPTQRLQNLAQTLRVRKLNIKDPKLIKLIHEIELRAEVELAKLTREI